MPPTKDSSPAKAPRTEKFSVGAAVEALDDQQLWYPATLVEERKDAVLVAFDGWSSQWNEWVAKDSKRLRPPRGWGTAKKPDDWQAESTILALDMEGKWYPAKVLHVSELRVQVHYQRWSSKWDEWIDKDAGRLRKLDEPPGADEQEAKGAATSAVSGGCSLQWPGCSRVLVWEVCSPQSCNRRSWSTLCAPREQLRERHGHTRRVAAHV